MKRVLVARNNRTVYDDAFDISSRAQRGLVSLYLVRERLRCGVYYDPGEAPAEITEWEIEQLPLGLRPLAREMMYSYNERASRHAKEKGLWHSANKAVELHDGELAWNVLVARGSREGEQIMDHELIEVRNPLNPTGEDVELDHLRNEVRKLKVEVEMWKRRAAKHGCNVDTGDPDCG